MKKLNNYLIIPVPYGAMALRIENDDDGDSYLRLTDAGLSGASVVKYLPDGDWEQAEPTEEVCAEMMDGEIVKPRGVGGQTVDSRFMNYETDIYEFRDPLDSFESWKRKQGFKNVVVLKNQTKDKK